MPRTRGIGFITLPTCGFCWRPRGRRSRFGAAVYEMQSPSIVVFGNDEAEEGNAKFVHRIAVDFRLGAQRLGAAFLAMCNWIAASDSQKFTEAGFHPAFVLRGRDGREAGRQGDPA